MTISLEALAAYIAWTLPLASLVIIYRSSRVMSKQRTADAWTRERHRMSQLNNIADWT